jgi:hypothetical protein
LHIILVPLFPLLGVSHWVLLHGRPGVKQGSVIGSCFTDGRA